MGFFFCPAPASGEKKRRVVGFRVHVLFTETEGAKKTNMKPEEASRDAKRSFLFEAQNLLDHVEQVLDKKSASEIEKMRMSLELVKHNRGLMDELLQRFVQKVRTRLTDADEFVVTQDVVNDITGTERIRICSARITPTVNSAVLRCVRRMDSLVDAIQPACADVK